MNPVFLDCYDSEDITLQARNHGDRCHWIWASVPAPGFDTDFKRVFHLFPKTQSNVILHFEEGVTENGVVEFLIHPDAEANFFIMINNPKRVSLRISATLLGARSAININGFGALGQAREVNIRSTLCHRASHSFSDQVFKVLALDEAQFFLKTDQVIEKNITQADSKQRAHFMVMNRARAQSLPNLQVLSSDVKAAHGASFGSLDPLQLTYLQSRGIKKPQAVSMLLESYAKELWPHGIEQPFAKDWQLDRGRGNVLKELSQFKKQTQDFIRAQSLSIAKEL